MLVLEAQDRIGGRVRTESWFGDDGRAVDMGATFIHGFGPGNPMWDIAVRHLALVRSDGGGYAEGWTRQCPWYKAGKPRSGGPRRGRKISQAEVDHAFYIMGLVWEEIMSSNSNRGDLKTDSELVMDWSIQKEYDKAIEVCLLARVSAAA